jgi:hypothetical protein
MHGAANMRATYTHRTKSFDNKTPKTAAKWNMKPILKIKLSFNMMPWREVVTDVLDDPGQGTPNRRLLVINTVLCAVRL